MKMTMERTGQPASRIPPTQLVDCSYSAYTATRTRLPESHQRSWWIVHTSPTRPRERAFLNPTNAVGGSFILSLHSHENAAFRIPPTQLVDRSYSAYTESHQRSWWIVHTQPTQPRERRFPNPTNAVGGSFILSLHSHGNAAFPNPTNAVGGSFILSLHSHGNAGFRIPPTQLVDRSYSAYTESHQRSWWIVHTRPTPNPTNAVGGSFILSLHSHGNAGFRIPPTQLVDRSYSAYNRTA